jgi:hypothetical protein
MNERNVRSSDINAAREISRRLSGRAGTWVPADGAQTRYVTFRRPQASGPGPNRAVEYPEARVEPVASSPVASAPIHAPFRQQMPADLGSWEAFLAWCSRQTSCRTALLVDGQGFVIARLGNSSLEDSDGLAAELSLAMEQLASIDVIPGGLRSAVLEFGSQHVVGFRATIRTEVFLLGIVADCPITLADKESIHHSFADALAKLG